TFALENEDLCQALRRRVKHYKREHPALSSQQIAKRFNMSSSTLNRIENQDIKNPTIDQVLKVLRGTGETDDLLGFIEEFYPDIADTYKRVYSENKDRTFINTDIEKYFRDKSTFTIMLLAFSGNGTSRSEIVELLGNSGLRTLTMLIQSEVLTEDSNGVINKGRGRDVNMSQEALKDLLSNTIESHYKPENFGTGFNFLSFQTKQADRNKVMPKINIVLKDAFSKIHNILNDSENSGNDKIFIGLVSDSILEKKARL
ncbi:MAG: helix-turn-helix domain-containing protein, partial [Bacteriovoracaceae bacterium]|nr:helix-turn-helix domain-containing protein [Bacteriovoracaceae bacterium]